MQMLYKSYLMSEEFEGPHGHYTLEKGLLHVNYAPKRFLLDTTWRCTWKLTLGKGLIFGERAEKCRCCAKVFSCWKSFKVHNPHDHDTQEKSLLHVNYVLKRFLVETTWRCTWSSRWVKALFLEKVLTNADVVQKFSHVGKVWRSTWSQFIEERLSSCEICTKPFSSGHNLKMHITSLSLTNAVCTISCLFYWNVVIKLEPQLTQVGAN